MQEMTQPDRQGQLDPGGSPSRPPRRGWKIFIRFCTGLFTGIDLRFLKESLGCWKGKNRHEKIGLKT